jgi:hypothetical protein
MSNYRQGDVILKFSNLSQIPEDYKPKKDKVLAYGEKTGHKHQVISETAMVYENESGQLLLHVIDDDINLVHEEHGAHTEIAPGIYEINIPQEYDYMAEIDRKVID